MNVGGENVPNYTPRSSLELVQRGAVAFFNSVYYIRDLDMMPSFRHLLKMLAGFDANFLVFTMTLFCIASWSTTYDQVRLVDQEKVTCEKINMRF